MANPARAYLTTQVETTTQGELLLMLYEAAIKFLKRAKIEIDNKDYAKKGIYISKAMAIIHELSESLNKEKGGDITPKLAQLYMFCTSQLVKANIRLDNKMIDEVIKIMDGLRSAYAQIVPQLDGKTAPPAGQPQAPQAATPQTAAPANPAPKAAPAAPPVRPQTSSYGKMPMQMQMQRPTAPVPPAPPQPQAAPAAQPPAAEAEAQAAAPIQPPVQPPVQPQVPSPPKLRTGANAAKFRAANAYTNTVR